MALFGEKYGETVRTITIVPAGTFVDSAALESVKKLGNEPAEHPTSTVERLSKYSYELCGGTHLERTSDVGAFLIASEGSAAAGVRRIEAVTGRAAYALIAKRFRTLENTAVVLKSSLEDAPARAASLQEEISSLKQDIAALRMQAALAAFETLKREITKYRDVAILAMNVPHADVDILRALTDKFRQENATGVAVLSTSSETKSPTLVASVTEDLVKRGIRAADIIIAIGGRGGGRPNLAQGSLPDASKIDEALGKVADAVKAAMK